jgi:hypothetical protein
VWPEVRDVPDDLRDVDNRLPPQDAELVVIEVE